MKKIIPFVFLILFLVTACSNSDQKVIKSVEDAYKDLSSVQINGNEESNNDVIELEEYYQFNEEQIISENITSELTSYKNNDTYFIDSASNFIPIPPDKYGTMRASLNRKVELYKDPFEYYSKFDDSFTDHLATDKQDNQYIISYEPKDETQIEEFYKNFMLDYLVDAQEENNGNDPLEKANFNVHSFELIFEVDQDTSYITKMRTKEDVVVEIEGNSLDLDRETTYEFSQFNEEQDFSVPKDAINITN